MAGIALALFAVWFILVFIVRSLLQRRRTGDSGVRAGGFVLMVPNVVGLLALALIFIGVELQVRYVEEPHLRQVHGAIYTDYESRVGRFVPSRPA